MVQKESMFWRNAVVALIVVIVAVVAYFSLMPRPAEEPEDFVDSYLEMQSLWKGKGVPSVVLHSSLDELVKLPESDLQALEEELQEFGDSSGMESISLLSDAYAEFAGAAAARKQIESILLKCSASELSACGKLSLYEQLLEAEKRFDAANKAFLLKAGRFVDSFPLEADSIGMVKGESSGSLPGEVAEIEGLIVKLRGVCE